MYFVGCLLQGKFLFKERICFHKTERKKQQVSCPPFFQVIPIEGCGYGSPETIDTSIPHGKIFSNTCINKITESLRQGKPDKMLSGGADLFPGYSFNRIYFLP